MQLKSFVKLITNHSTNQNQILVSWTHNGGATYRYNTFLYPQCILWEFPNQYDYYWNDMWNGVQVFGKQRPWHHFWVTRGQWNLLMNWLVVLTVLFLLSSWKLLHTALTWSTPQTFLIHS